MGQANGIYLDVPFGQEPLKPRIYALKLFELPGIGDIHAAVLVPPAIERLLGNPVLSANIRDVKLPALSFVQNANDLLLGKSLALHALCPSSLSRTLTYHLVLILGSRSGGPSIFNPGERAQVGLQNLLHHG